MGPGAIALASSASNTAGNIGGQVLGYGFGKKSAKKQLKYQKWAAAEMPSYHVAGLKKAGLNPILAVNPGGSLPNISATSAGSNVRADLADAYQKSSAAALVREQRKKVTDERNYLKAETALKNAQRRSADANANLDENFSRSVNKSTPLTMLEWARRFGLTSAASQVGGRMVGRPVINKNYKY